MWKYERNLLLIVIRKYVSSWGWNFAIAVAVTCSSWIVDWMNKILKLNNPVVEAVLLKRRPRRFTPSWINCFVAFPKVDFCSPDL